MEMPRITLDDLEFEEAAKEMGLSAQEIQEGPKQVGPPKKFILVVDDVLEFLNMVAKVLGADYDVGIAKNAATAVKILGKRPVDLMFLDQGLPDMFGLDFIQLIRRIPATRNLPVIFLSANITTEFKREAMKWGVTIFLDKPVSALDLRQAAVHYLGYPPEKYDEKPEDKLDDKPANPETKEKPEQPGEPKEPEKAKPED
jgi:CheY-like chemotaxis protein